MHDNPSQPSIRQFPDFEIQKTENRINEISGAISRYQEEIKKIKKNNNKLENPNNKDPNRDKKIYKNKEEIENLEKQIKEKEAEGQLLLNQIVELKNSERYTDCSNFFRYLRNSLSHGTYSIDYIKALESGDLTNLEITFSDYPLGDKNHANPNFEISVTAKQLLELVSKIQQKAIEQTKNNSDRFMSSFLYEALNSQSVDMNDIENESIIEQKEKSLETSKDKEDDIT